MTLAFVPSGFSSRSRDPLRALKRSALVVAGGLVVILGLLIGPLPGPGGIPVVTLGLVLILRGSWKAMRLFIRAQYARPKWVYPFRRLMRKRPEFAPVFWQQALRAEKLVLRRANRPLKGWRKRLRRTSANPPSPDSGLT